MKRRWRAGPDLLIPTTLTSSPSENHSKSRNEHSSSMQSGLKSFV